jgi:hypothetical protein
LIANPCHKPVVVVVAAAAAAVAAVVVVVVMMIVVVVLMVYCSGGGGIDGGSGPSYRHMAWGVQWRRRRPQATRLPLPAGRRSVGHGKP